MEALRNQKAEYTDGLWNVSTVLMGGLGNEPDLEGKYYIVAGFFLYIEIYLVHWDHRTERH